MGRVSVEVKERYNAKTYDRIYVRLKKTSEINKDTLLEAAEKQGVSVNSWITEAIEEKYKKQKASV